MRYRQFTGTLGELKKRIQEAEHRHFQVSLDRTVAERLEQDDKILQADRELRLIEETLSALYQQLPDGE